MQIIKSRQKEVIAKDRCISRSTGRINLDIQALNNDIS